MWYIVHWYTKACLAELFVYTECHMCFIIIRSNYVRSIKRYSKMGCPSAVACLAWPYPLIAQCEPSRLSATANVGFAKRAATKGREPCRAIEESHLLSTKQSTRTARTHLRSRSRDVPQPGASSLKALPVNGDGSTNTTIAAINY